MIDAFEFVVLSVGSSLLVGGLIVIVARELGTHPERRLVGRGRDILEVLLPLAGAAALVVAVWAAVV